MRIVLFLVVVLGGCTVPLSTAPEAGPRPSDRRAPALDRLGAEVHVETNHARSRASRRTLAWDRDLAAVARAHSRDMARRGYFDHVSPDGRDPQDRARRGGVTCRIASGRRRVRTGIAENLYMMTRYASAWERRLARGREVRYDWMTADEIAERTVQSWLESRGHRRNLLDRDARAHGIGVAVGRDHRVYVTQVLC
ncbi:MAG: CAP domain-containing protein [Bacteroidota bacterium]